MARATPICLVRRSGLATPSMLSQIESDRARPSYRLLVQIANRLEVPLEQLISDVDMNLKFTSTQKMARAMVASKDYASAIPFLHELLDAPSVLYQGRKSCLISLSPIYIPAIWNKRKNGLLS